MDRAASVLAVKKLTGALSALSLAAVLVAGDVSAAQADVITCQGLPATIVGPTEGQTTAGTEGDDVIVAPMYGNSTVWALGGDDTVCLVDAPSTVSRDPFVSVDAGAGNDSVVNETTTSIGGFTVTLGSGADSYVGNAFNETVAAASMSDGTGSFDTEVDVISTGGGNDWVLSGTALPGWPNHDGISTGAGSDGVTYAGLGGGSIDNGDGADSLVDQRLLDREASIDNTTRRASLGSGTVSWTNVDGFSARVAPGSSLSFAGSDAAEHVNISGTVLDLAVPATISMGGGDDGLRLENYLPTSVDTGAGDDDLSYLACQAATIKIDDAAQCTHRHRPTGADHARRDRVPASPSPPRPSTWSAPPAPTAWSSPPSNMSESPAAAETTSSGPVRGRCSSTAGAEMTACRAPRGETA